MTDLNELVHEIDQLMMTLKTDWVSGDPESTDLLIYIHVYRDEKMVAALQCPVDRDIALQAAWVASMGMAADILVVTFESWHSKEPLCPVTGKEWEPGEMAFLGTTSPEAREKGWVWECLTTMAYDRHENMALLSRPYAIKGNQVTYDDSTVIDSSEEGSSGGGFMHDQMVHTMAQKNILQVMEETDQAKAQVVAMLGEMLTEDQKLFHLDAACLNALAERKLIESAVLMADEGTERSQLIKDRFGDPDTSGGEGETPVPLSTGSDEGDQ